MKKERRVQERERRHEGSWGRRREILKAIVSVRERLIKNTLI